MNTAGRESRYSSARRVSGQPLFRSGGANVLIGQLTVHARGRNEPHEQHSPHQPVEAQSVRETERRESPWKRRPRSWSPSIPRLAQQLVRQAELRRLQAEEPDVMQVCYRIFSYDPHRLLQSVQNLGIQASMILQSTILQAFVKVVRHIPNGDSGHDFIVTSMQAPGMPYAFETAGFGRAKHELSHSLPTRSPGTRTSRSRRACGGR